MTNTDPWTARAVAILLDRRLRGGLTAVTAVAMLATLWGALVYAPREAVEGDVQRLFYIHVPMAWVAYMAFGAVALASAMYLWRKEPAWDIVARSSAEIGLVFTSLVLVTGSIWGRPIWGTWWEWDARLTTTLILWVLYAGYLAIRSFAGVEQQGARFAAVVGIIAFLDVPIVHLSVSWWRTLHPQPIIVKPLGESPALPDEMLFVIAIGLITMTLLYTCLLAQRFAVGLLEYELRLARRRAYTRGVTAPTGRTTARTPEVERG
jgi:heme exporter protein C